MPAGDNLTIRGFSARTDIFIDGVRDFGGYSRDPFNLEQVEVTKGPASVDSRPRLDRRLGQPGQQGAVAARPARALALGGGTDDYKRGTLDINQPLERTRRAPRSASTRMWTTRRTYARPRRGRRTALGRRAVARLRPRHADARSRSSYFRLDRTTCPTTACPGCRPPTSRCAGYANQPAPVDFSNFYGLRTATTRRPPPTSAPSRSSTTSATPLTLRNLLRYGSTKRDSVITAPRFLSNTSTDIRRAELQSRDQTDTIAGQPDSTSTAPLPDRPVAHALVAGVELSREIDENLTRSTGPAAPDADLYHPDPRRSLHRRRSRRTGANDRGHRAIRGALRLRHRQARRALGADRRPALGPLRHRLRLDRRATGVVHAVRAHRQMVSWRAGVVYKPRRTAASTVGYGTSFNPSAEGLSPERQTADLEPGEDAQLRGRHQVGSCRDAGCRSTRRSSGPRRPTRATPASTRRSADRARRRAARARRRARRAGRPHRRAGSSSAATPIMTADRARRTRRPSVDKRPRANAAPSTFESVDHLSPAVATSRSAAACSSSDARLPQHANTTTCAELLRCRRHGRVRRQPAAHACGSTPTTSPTSTTSTASAAATSFPARPLGVADRRRSSSRSTIDAVADSRRADRRAGRARRASCSSGRVGRRPGHRRPPVGAAKDNLQLPGGRSRRARELGEMILAALQRNPLFISAALPLRVFPPLFNRYQGGQSFGTHVDNAIRQVPGTPHRIRTDLSATLFFTDPDEYDGGELMVEDTYGVHSVKLPAGHMVLYPVDQPASRAAGHARRADRLVLLDPEHGARRRRSARCCSISTPRSSASTRAARPSRRGAADRRLSQPAPSMGGGLRGRISGSAAAKKTAGWGNSPAGRFIRGTCRAGLGPAPAAQEEGRAHRQQDGEGREARRCPGWG